VFILFFLHFSFIVVCGFAIVLLYLFYRCFVFIDSVFCLFVFECVFLVLCFIILVDSLCVCGLFFLSGRYGRPVFCVVGLFVCVCVFPFIFVLFVLFFFCAL